MQEQIKNINTLEELQALYASVFGKNGTMTARLKQMRDLDNDARAALNQENTTLRELFKTRQTEIENAVMMAALAGQKLDVSLNPMPENLGTIHPLTQAPLQEGCVSYHLRTGKHNLTPYDWKCYMDFADRHGWRK